VLVVPFDGWIGKPLLLLRTYHICADSSLIHSWYRYTPPINVLHRLTRNVDLLEARLGDVDHMAAVIGAGIRGLQDLDLEPHNNTIELSGRPLSTSPLSLSLDID
jgi:hypothetical protein